MLGASLLGVPVILPVRELRATGRVARLGSQNAIEEIVIQWQHLYFAASTRKSSCISRSLSGFFAARSLACE